MCFSFSHIQPNTVVIAPVGIFKVKAHPLKLKPLPVTQPTIHFYYANGFTYPAIPVITAEQPDVVQCYHWGLVPPWVKTLEQANEIRKNTLNARIESVTEKPAFRSSVKQHRCLIPATGFFEWRDIGNKKYPYLILVKDEEPGFVRTFCFAGLYNQWVNHETGEVTDTCTILTTDANNIMATIHNSKKRMPVILTPEQEPLWLQPEQHEEAIQQFTKPYPDAEMMAFSISKRITQRGVERNVPELLEYHSYAGVEPFLDGATLI